MSADARSDSLSALRAFAVAFASGVAVVGIYLVFVRTTEGQRVDQSALNHLGWSTQARDTVSTVLDVITIGGMALVLAACVLIALARRRWGLAVGAVVLVGLANALTQVLKHQILTRPELGYGTTNSLPSGHTTVVGVDHDGCPPGGPPGCPLAGRSRRGRERRGDRGRHRGRRLAPTRATWWPPCW